MQERTPPWGRRAKKKTTKASLLARRHSPTRLACPARRTRCNLQSAKLYQQSITHPLLKQNKNTVWTDSQDYGANEISYTSKTSLFHKTTRFTSEIITLFRVPPQLFRRQFKSDDADDNERDGKEPERRRRLSEKDDTRNHTADGTDSYPYSITRFHLNCTHCNRKKPYAQYHSTFHSRPQYKKRLLCIFRFATFRVRRLLT